MLSYKIQQLGLDLILLHLAQTRDRRLPERCFEGADSLFYGAASSWRIGERIQHDEIVDRAVASVAAEHYC